MGRRITILGMGPSAYQRALCIDQFIKGTEVWGLNNGYLSFELLRAQKGFDRFFELHNWAYLKTWVPGKLQDGREINNWAELNRLGCPVYVGEHVPVVTNQVHYPWEAIAAHFHVDGKVYFLGSPSLMLALALYEHDSGDEIDYIQSYGIDTSPEEPTHAQQRQSWTYWIAKAEERGIKIGGTGTLFKDEPEHDEGLKGVREALNKRVAEMRIDGPVTDFAIASYCTDDDYYRPKMQRLEDQAKSFGLDFVSIVYPVPEGKTPAEVIQTEARDVERELLDKAGKPILYIDADDELLARPSFPECDAGTMRNPELGVIETHLQIGPHFFVSPTENGYKFLKVRKTLGESINTNMHRAMNSAWALLHTKNNAFGTYLDISRYTKGCIRYNPSPIGHRPQALIT